MAGSGALQVNYLTHHLVTGKHQMPSIKTSSQNTNSCAHTHTTFGTSFF